MAAIPTREISWSRDYLIDRLLATDVIACFHRSLTIHAVEGSYFAEIKKRYLCNNMRTGIFVGSFDPFTIGHDNIVRRALPLFDRIIIGIGVNERKQYLQDADTRKRKIQDLYRNESRITVKTYSDLTIDFAHREKADFIIKGIRSMKDFEYEREQADINRRLGDIETLLLFAEPGLEAVSSSLVRELVHFGKDVRRFLP